MQQRQGQLEANRRRPGTRRTHEDRVSVKTGRRDGGRTLGQNHERQGPDAVLAHGRRKRGRAYATGAQAAKPNGA